MQRDTPRRYVSRAGEKLRHALDAFGIDPTNLDCADLGSNVGGFVDCLLQAGAARVFAVERGYGVVDYRLRTDPRVTVMERTDARLVTLPSQVDLVTIDAGWTRQREIVPAALRNLKPAGRIISLIKPHYEAPPEFLKDGVVPDEAVDDVLIAVRDSLGDLDPRVKIVVETRSPIRGQGGNPEFLWLMIPSADSVQGEGENAS